MLKPYPFQKDAIQAGLESNLLVSLPCGSGKTLVGIEIARHRKSPTLIICRKQARDQWADFIRSQHRGTPKVAVLDHVRDAPRRPQWVVIHYAALLPLLSEKSSHPLLKTTWETVILDEAHRIKNRKAQRTRAVKKLSANRRIALTATEIENLPDDLWSVLNWLDSDEWGAYSRFRGTYVNVKFNEFLSRKEVLGAKNLPLLAHRLSESGMYFRRGMEQIADQLPPLTETHIPVSLTGRLRKAYLQVKQSEDLRVMVAEEEIIVPNVLAQITLLRRVLSEGVKGAPSLKQAWVINYVKDNPHEKILIFTAFRKTAKSLSQKLGAPLVMGSEPLPNLSRRPTVLVGTIKAMGESLDLPWFTTAVFVDSEWSSIEMTQAKSRIHRLSSKGHRHIIYLYHPRTVDDLIRKAIEGKYSTIELLRDFLRSV